MKTIIRNFINVLIRFKVATILNVAGLAVAFAAFLIIMMQVSFERNLIVVIRTRPDLSDGTFFPGWSKHDPLPTVDRGVYPLFPHIDFGTLINPYIGEMYVTVTRKKESKVLRRRSATC